MTAKTASKHELKTRETRAQLLKAAETIFVRDGYAGAELGEVAALAGRTKGSIYAQFRSKEDLFLALIEDRSHRYQDEMKEALAQSTTIDGNIEALREFYLRRAEEQAWPLLYLEFKMFAMRHPESKKRLHDLQTELLDEKRIAGFLGAASKGKDAISRSAAILTMHPLVSSLVLEAQLGTIFEDKAVLKKVIVRVLDALLDVPTR
jgi:AcrR family transcriptional regulator